MSLSTKFLIAWGGFVLLSLFTSNIFIDAMMVLATIAFVLSCMSRDGLVKKSKWVEPVEIPTMVVLYGTSFERNLTAALYKTDPENVVLATEPWKLHGLSYCPRTARSFGWEPSLREKSLVEQTEHQLDVLERKYGIPSYDD